MKPIVYILIFLIFNACTSATIGRHSFQKNEATILGATEKGLIVQKGYQRYMIPHKDIYDIDHPGNVLIVLGSILGIFAIPPYIVSDFDPDILFPSLVSLGLLTWGIITYASSQNNMRTFYEGSKENIKILNSNYYLSKPIKKATIEDDKSNKTPLSIEKTTTLEKKDTNIYHPIKIELICKEFRCDDRAILSEKNGEPPLCKWNLPVIYKGKEYPSLGIMFNKKDDGCYEPSTFELSQKDKDSLKIISSQP